MDNHQIRERHEKGPVRCAFSQLKLDSSIIDTRAYDNGGRMTTKFLAMNRQNGATHFWNHPRWNSGLDSEKEEGRKIDDGLVES